MIEEKIHGGSADIEIYSDFVLKKFILDDLNPQIHHEFSCMVTEIYMMKTLSHPNIIKPLDMWMNDHVVTVKMKRYNECNISNVKNMDMFIKKLMEALLYLHLNKIAHNDIKRDNVLIDDRGNPILIDLGTCSYYIDEYLAHDTEIYRPRIDNSMTTYKIDMWNLGLLLLNLLTNNYIEDNIDFWCQEGKVEEMVLQTTEKITKYKDIIKMMLSMAYPLGKIYESRYGYKTFPVIKKSGVNPSLSIERITDIIAKREKCNHKIIYLILIFINRKDLFLPKDELTLCLEATYHVLKHSKINFFI